MKIDIFQKGFNFSQDGPGNRLVYHLCGCNMRCPWCANPEGLSPGGGAADVEALIDEVLRCRSMFFEGGGVTFTGGEPTVQFEALKTALTELHRRGVDTAIETNASHPRLPELFCVVDHLLMDLKHPDPDKHLEITGVRQEAVLENLRRACAEHPDVLIHLPTINGYNASPDELTATAALLAELPGGRFRVEPLWYHEYGKDKWLRAGKTYAVGDGFVADAQKRTLLDALHARGLNVVRT